MSKKIEKLVDIARRCKVSAFIPPDKLINIADERTSGILSYFLISSRRMDFREYNKALEVLVRSCYMQGLNDTIDAVIKTKLK